MNETGSDPVPPDLSLPSSRKARRATARPLTRTLKRGLDIVVSATTIFLLLPLMLLVAGTIWAFDRGPPVIRETSLGHGGRTFGRLLFRTTEPKPTTQSDTPDEPVSTHGAGRMTAIGRVLSQASLDELPMLLNVLRGEMSLVGPRPLTEGTGRFGPDLDARLTFAPGLTGAWKVEGRRGATESEKAGLDLHYARHWSLRRDFAIMLRGAADAVVGRE